MSEQQVSVYTKRFFRCPNGCEHEFSVEHMLEPGRSTTAGPWYCDDCGKGWRLRFDGGEVFVR